MSEIAKLWHWHKNLQSVLNDIREAQSAIKNEAGGDIITRLNNLIARAERIAERLENELELKCYL